MFWKAVYGRLDKATGRVQKLGAMSEIQVFEEIAERFVNRDNPDGLEGDGDTTVGLPRKFSIISDSTFEGTINHNRFLKKFQRFHLGRD